MKKSQLLLTPFLLLPLLAFVGLPQAWVYEMTTTELESGEVSTTEMIVVGDRVKIEVPGGADGSDADINFLGDVGDIGEMVYNDHDDRTFIRMNQETLDQISSQLGDVQAQMAEAMAGIPEAQRKALMERMGGNIPGMPDMTPPEIEMRDTGETDTKAGYPCVKYELVVDGKVIQQMWMTDWRNIDGAEAVRGTFESFADFAEAMRKAIPFGEMFGGQDPMSALSRDHFAVVTVEMKDGQPVRETVLTGVSQREVDLSEIGPGPGYEEQRMGGDR